MEASSEGFGEFVQSGNWLVRCGLKGNHFTQVPRAWMTGVRIRVQPKEVRSRGPLALTEAWCKSSASEKGDRPVTKDSNLGLPPRLPPGSVSIGVLELVLYWLAGANC